MSNNKRMSFKVFPVLVDRDNNKVTVPIQVRDMVVEWFKSENAEFGNIVDYHWNDRGELLYTIMPPEYHPNMDNYDDCDNIGGMSAEDREAFQNFDLDKEDYPIEWQGRSYLIHIDLGFRV